MEYNNAYVRACTRVSVIFVSFRTYVLGTCTPVSPTRHQQTAAGRWFSKQQQDEILLCFRFARRTDDVATPNTLYKLYSNECQILERRMIIDTCLMVSVCGLRILMHSNYFTFREFEHDNIILRSYVQKKNVWNLRNNKHSTVDTKIICGSSSPTVVHGYHT